MHQDRLAARVPPSDHGEGRELPVLLVEDDAMVRSWVRLSLRDSQLRLAGEASSVAEARELVGRRRPNLLLVDHRLPDGTGTDLVQRLRREGVDRLPYS